MRAANASEAIVERIIATHLRPGIANLAPGTAHWSPPERLVEAALHGDGGYGDIRGEPALLMTLVLSDVYIPRFVGGLLP